MQGLSLHFAQKEHIEISDINSYGQLHPGIYRLIEFQEIFNIKIRVLL